MTKPELSFIATYRSIIRFALAILMTAACAYYFYDTVVDMDSGLGIGGNLIALPIIIIVAFPISYLLAWLIVFGITGPVKKPSHDS